MSIGNRRKARELAMQALFALDISGDADVEGLLERYCACFLPPRKSVDFFRQLVLGVLGARADIDAVVERYSSNWKINRMSCVDRNILRVAVYELLYCEDIPFKVSINEAIDIGKRFGTEESGAFINGILDAIRVELENGRLKVPVPRTPTP